MQYRVLKKCCLACYAVLVLYIISPILAVLVAECIAAVLGGQLNEAGPHPCLLFKWDIGGILYDMTMFFCFLPVTLISGGVILVLFSLVAVPLLLSAKPRVETSGQKAGNIRW